MGIGFTCSDQEPTRRSLHDRSVRAFLETARRGCCLGPAAGMSWPDDPGGQTELFECQDDGVGHIQFPLTVLHARAGWVVVVVVVPALSVSQESKQPIVATVFAGAVGAVAKQVGERIDAPRDVPDEHRPHENTPHEPTHRQLAASTPVTPSDAAHQKPQTADYRGMGGVELENRRRVAFKIAVVVVCEDVARVFLEEGKRAATIGPRVNSQPTCDQPIPSRGECGSGSSSEWT